jgi:hypothetical protein
MICNEGIHSFISNKEEFLMILKRLNEEYSSEYNVEEIEKSDFDNIVIDETLIEEDDFYIILNEIYDGIYNETSSFRLINGLKDTIVSIYEVDLSDLWKISE